MNIQHLKYVIEVSRAGSISQAAENLYMAQPNLSKAIKELEQTLNISIFKRTSKGAEITPKGQEFLHYAKGILRQYEELEALGRRQDEDVQGLRLSVPRASYVVDAFTSFVARLDLQRAMQVDFSETNALRAIRHVADRQSDIGIIRCKTEYQNYFIKVLEENRLVYSPVLSFRYQLLLSAQHPLAKRQVVDVDALQPYIEILHGDTAMPYMPQNITETEFGQTPGSKKVYVYERGSQFDLLARVPGTYIWVSPMPQDLLRRNGLVQKRCENSPNFVDLMIYPKDHHLSAMEKIFVEELQRSAKRVVRATA